MITRPMSGAMRRGSPKSPPLFYTKPVISLYKFNTFRLVYAGVYVYT